MAREGTKRKQSISISEGAHQKCTFFSALWRNSLFARTSHSFSSAITLKRNGKGPGFRSGKMRMLISDAKASEQDNGEEGERRSFGLVILD